MRRYVTLCLLGCALASVASTASAADPPRYHVARKIEIGGEGGWDYLIADLAARPLDVGRSTRVMVLFSPALSAEKPDVRATIIAPARLAAGSKATLTVEMTIGTGWHVQSHIPSEKYLIPTVVTLSASAGELSPIRYPKDVEKRFSFAEKPLRVYEGTVRFETSLQLPAGASGEVSITGTLSYQACNERQCFAPAKIPLAERFAVSDGGGAR